MDDKSKIRNEVPGSGGAPLADGKPGGRHAAQLHEVDEIMETATANMAHWSRLLKDACGLRDRLLAAQAGLAVPQSAERPGWAQRDAERANPYEKVIPGAEDEAWWDNQW